MLITIPDLLSAEQLAVARSLIATQSFQDGRLSAGRNASRVKHNQELAAKPEQLEKLNNLVMGALVKHPVYRFAALPRHVAAPFYARYREGMVYGDHVDDPVMGTGPRYRSDIAVTIFLNDTSDYDGGELQINTDFGPRQIKLAQGGAVLYPASSRHQVLPVTRGERLVAVTWVQSMVADTARRQLLYDLYKVRESLIQKSPDSEEAKTTDQVYVNLVRMWCDM